MKTTIEVCRDNKLVNVFVRKNEKQTNTTHVRCYPEQ